MLFLLLTGTKFQCGSTILLIATSVKESEKRVFTIMIGCSGALTQCLKWNESTKRVAELVGMQAMEVPSRNLSTHKLEYMMNLARWQISAIKLVKKFIALH